MRDAFYFVDALDAHEVAEAVRQNLGTRHRDGELDKHVVVLWNQTCMKVADGDVLGREGRKDVGDEIAAIVGKNIDVDGINADTKVGFPVHVDESAARSYVGTIAAMDGDAFAAGDVADDVIARNRRAALAKRDG